MNSWNGIGRLTRDPKFLETDGGTAICNLRIAVERRGKGVDYFDVKCFEGQATACAEHLTKGRQVAVTGRLRFEEFETQEREYASRVYIVADRVEFLGRRPRQDEGSQESEQPADEPATAGVAAEGAGPS